MLMNNNTGRLITLTSIALFITAVCPLQNASAQGWSARVVHSWKKGFSTGKKLTPSKVEKILASRAKRTAAQLPKVPAKQVEYWGPEDLPIERIMSLSFSRPVSFPYVDVPFWDQISLQAKLDYFVAANNRALKKLIQVQKLRFTALQRMAPVLWKNRVKFPAKDFDIPAMTQIMLERTPKNIDYLLLGEEHDIPEISALLVRFLRQYRAQNPERKIFFLTEFLPKGSLKTLKLKDMKAWDPDYGKVMQAAVKQGMSVRGLEPRAVYFAFSDVQTTGEDYGVPMSERVSLMATPEGLHLRNREWMADIKALRKRHPDALFIIYAGAEHLDYGAPFSIGSQLPKDKTFLISMMLRDAESPAATDLLNFVGKKKYPFLTQKVLTWNDPALCRAAGFDLRLSVDGKDLSYNTQYPSFPKKQPKFHK